MGLKSFVKELAGEEKTIFKLIESLYKDVKYDVFVFHDIVYSPKFGSIFRPDFIILDEKRGISVIEVKSYKNPLLKIDETNIYFKNGDKSISPFVQASDYRLKLFNYLNFRDVKLEMKYIKANLIFSKLKQKIEGIGEDFLNVFYKTDLKSIELDDLFPKIKVSFDQGIVSELKKSLNSTYYFDKPLSLFSDDEKVSSYSSLDKKQDEIVNVQIGGHHLVKGIPGSGKSIAAISRAIHVVKERPDWKVLILSVNRKLADQNKKSLIERLKGLRHFGLKSGNVRCTTYMEFVQSLYGENTGIKSYKAKLDFLTQKLSENEIARDWDYIIVDEYQDFNAEQLDIIKRSSVLHKTKINRREKEIENLFLVGDQLQQLNGTIGSHPWKDLGIEIQGRTIKLKTVYRSTSNIIDLALSYIMDSSKEMKKEVISYYEGVDDLSCNNEVKAPVDFVSGDEMVTSIEIRDWLNKVGVSSDSLKEVLVIVPDNLKLKSYVETLFSDECKRGMKIGMPSSIKGIESKYVILWSIDKFQAHFDSKTNKIKKIYMSLTRATKGMLIHSQDVDCEDFKRLQAYVESVLKVAA